MAWKDLSIAQRSQLMNLMRHNGISSLSEMRRLYDLSSTNLPIEEDTFNAKPVAPVYGNGGDKKRKETAYARKYREEQEAKAKREREHPTLKNVFRHDIASESGDEYYDVINARYTQAMDALKRRGFSYEDSLRLAPLIVTQNIVEGGWRVARPDDNNFGGLRYNGRFLKFNSPEEYYDNYLDLLDRKDEGGKLFEMGGPEYPTSSTRAYLRGLADYVLRRKTPRSFIKSEYRPTLGDNGETYYTRPGLKNEVALNLFGGSDYGKGLLGENYFYKDFDDAYNSISGHPMNRDMRATSNGTLGQYSVTTGTDDRGRYLSFTDKFDHIFIPGYPIHIYDRIYEDEVPLLYNAEDSALGLGDALSRSPLLKDMKASGGRIHIKPENRGKFTALKKRTGHSASWFKAHGTPAQKKMAIFALNSRHWGKKKLHGGIKF